MLLFYNELFSFYSSGDDEVDNFLNGKEIWADGWDFKMEGFFFLMNNFFLTLDLNCILT